jgi:hypothetical protein
MKISLLAPGQLNKAHQTKLNQSWETLQHISHTQHLFVSGAINTLAENLQPHATQISMESLQARLDDFLNTSDVFYYHCFAEHFIFDTMRLPSRGVVVLHLHTLPEKNSQKLLDYLDYADILVLETQTLHKTFFQQFQKNFSRPILLAEAHDFQDSLRQTLFARLPKFHQTQPVSINALATKQTKPTIGLSPSRSGLPQDHLKQLSSRADIILRGYQVRSSLPLVGKALAWLRRNSTSHLREPYLDPILERQVLFNKQMVEMLNELANQHTSNTLQLRLSAIELRLEHLSQQMSLLEKAVFEFTGQGTNSADIKAALRANQQATAELNTILETLKTITEFDNPTVKV